MEPIRLYPGSKVTVLVPLRDILEDADLSSDVVQFAFTTSGPPGEDDFTEGTWVESTDGSRIVTNAAIVVDNGHDTPGDVTLEPGTYRVYVQLIDNPDQPILRIERQIVVYEAAA